jgi:hypothetical protein
MVWNLKKLLNPPLLSAVVVKLTCGGCGAIGGDPIFPPRGPLAMHISPKKTSLSKDNIRLIHF